MTHVTAHVPAHQAGPGFARKLDEFAWALFLIATGIIWLVSETEVPPGTWLMTTGILLLGLNAVRTVSNLPVSGFTTLLGALALVAGMAAFWGVELPLLALGLIVFGLAVLMRQMIAPDTQKSACGLTNENEGRTL